MWRHLLYLVCIVEAAFLAAILVAMVIEPDLVGFAPSPKTRQLCAVGALVLVVGWSCAVVGWIRSALADRTWLNL